MTSLLPCPFCGGKPILEAESCHGETGYHVLCVCRDCKLTPATYLCETKEQAIKAWNTRAECTCRWLALANDGERSGTCSYCGYTEEWDGGYIPPNYCPNCGAKVVD